MNLTKAESKTYKNFIDGIWVDGSSREVYSVFNPADTSEHIGNFPLSTKKDVEKAVQSSYEAFQTWRKIPASERAEYVYSFIDLLWKNKDRLGKILCKEQGKPLNEAVTEVVRGVKEMRFVAGEALRLDGTTLPSDRRGVINMTIRVPIGVVAAITPWNFPVLTPLRKVLPALVAGCTVVLKPATQTPLTAVTLTELLEKAGFPRGTINLVMGKGGTIGKTLVEHPLVKGVSFTGSTRVGQRIYELAAKDFKKVQLEMGGKNPAVVAEYKDLKGAAAEIVKSAFANAGQRCTAISRVIVLEKHADELINYIIDQVRHYRVGNGMDPETQIGPVIGEEALNTIINYIKSAEADGAKVAFGGRRLTGDIYDKGYYLEPTVITDVTPDMKVAREEIFGPVLVIIRVTSTDEIIKVCNSTEYGLTATIFTDSRELVYRFIEDVESGMVHVNNGTISEGHMPFGGVKNSGVGPYSIGETNKDFYTDLKVVYYQH